MHTRKVAFNIGTARFVPIGFHPQLDKNGTVLRKTYNLGPGMYEPQEMPCTFKSKRTVSMWKRQTDCEEFSKQLGFRNASILETREFMAKHLGPGSHEICELPRYESPCLNQSFGKQKKFKIFEDLNPPPGSYNYEPAKHFFNESPTILNRQTRFRDTTKPWNLASNRYKVKELHISDKVVSKRGPYDLFTGPRDPANIFNKFSPPKRCTPDKFYNWPTDLEYVLHHEHKSRYGCFLKAPKFPPKPTVRMMLADLSTCYKDPDAPGPASYYIKGKGIISKPPSKYPFDSGTRGKSGLDWRIQPGPGRYTPKTHRKCGATKCGTSVFKSRTQRSEYKATVYNSF
ncbi:PREDICTED: lymphocyte expansion molecule-like [Nicrophorus vespilloides]|uniref:Lymphocyte expansion molecule-like n=1 Tax=Nicrophorus vespilloides TaxID=110193 RepID=A0ABM1N5K4_NICVS|nr:PREDICTED: lymphocyte expansion molecule-like [Nicrophorus vespilloides]